MAKKSKPKTTPAKAANTKKTKFCAHSRCKQAPVSEGYCRLHYIVHWKELKSGEKQKAERRLNSYIDRLMKKYPEDYMDKLKESLESDEKFKEAVQEVEVETEGEKESDREFLEKFSRYIKVED